MSCELISLEQLLTSLVIINVWIAPVLCKWKESLCWQKISPDLWPKFPSLHMHRREWGEMRFFVWLAGQYWKRIRDCHLNCPRERMALTRRAKDGNSSQSFARNRLLMGPCYALQTIHMWRPQISIPLYEFEVIGENFHRLICRKPFELFWCHQV